MTDHRDHVRYLDVDDYDTLYEACYQAEGTTMCGDAIIVGTVTPTRAEAVRRAARAFREGLGTTRGLRGTRAGHAR